MGWGHVTRRILGTLVRFSVFSLRRIDMKKLFVFLTCLAALFAMTAMGVAQHSKTSSTKLKAASKAMTFYACEKCEMASTKPGKCPMCKASLKKVNAKTMYACDHCHTTSAKAGKCMKCGMAMEKVAVTYACDKCHTTSAMAGKCKMCHAEMKKHTMKMSKM
ncbi:MAG: hypothetical protein BGO01_10340 [Armatimonadetes bacterium 55-13]|nr:MAG: hypothetical protein BGO01_10340 [Armatimonadetes bacterium 55-13]